MSILYGIELITFYLHLANFALHLFILIPNILVLLSFTCQGKSELNFIFYKTLRTERQGDVFQEESYRDEKLTGELIC